jgi:anthranilate synthase component 2
MKTLLVIDNYDSFTYNLVQMFMPFGLSIRVVRSDRISMDQVTRLDPAYILISPGPKDPRHAGISVALIRALHRRIPIFGVCLGMQCINEAFGGRTVRAPVPMHGKTSLIRHNRDALFAGLETPFKAARYHSLASALVSASGQELKITALADDGVIMGLSHCRYPLHGVQFHPESFLTENGSVLIENFLKTGAWPSVLE